MKRISIIGILVTLGVLLASCSKETIVLNDPTIIGQTLTLQVGETHLIQYLVEPEGTPVTWTSSNPAIAIVLGDYVSAANVGQVEIMGTTPKGGSVSFNVNVVAIPVTGFNIPASREMYMRQTINIPVTDIVPETADARSINWSIDVENVISWSIESDKIVIRGENEGVVTLTGTGDNGLTHSCKITVNYYNMYIYATTKSHDYDILAVGDPVDYKIGQTIQIVNEASAVWSSSDPSVISIEDYQDSPHLHKLIPLKPGTSTITAIAGEYSASLDILVIGDDYQPYFTNARVVDQYMKVKWPYNKMENILLSDGDEICVVPTDIAKNFFIDAVLNQSTVDGYFEQCLNDMHRIPYIVRSTVIYSVSDSSVQPVIPGILPYGFYFKRYDPDSWGTITAESPSGKKCTIRFRCAINYVGISDIDNPRGYHWTRKNLGSTSNGGTITVSKSKLEDDKKYCIDVSSDERLGYSIVKPAGKGSGSVKSSNESVAKVENDTWGEIAYLSFAGCTTGTTEIRILSAEGVAAASFTLQVTD